jgi:single-stranded-DNA-specific exonuclease
MFTAEAERSLGSEELVASLRVDAVLSGRELDLELAEALAALAPFGRGNPKVSLMLPAVKFSEPRSMGKGKHVRFTVASAGSRLGAVAFGMATLPVTEGALADSLFSLEVNDWNGISEPRLNLQHAQPCKPEAITLIGEDGSYLERVWSELEIDPSELAKAPADEPRRNVHDLRRGGIAGTLMRLVASGEPVLVLCADAHLRMAHMAATIGGFALCSYATLEREPQITKDYVHVALLDPPESSNAKRLALSGEEDGHAHLLWGDPEIDFAGRILEREHNLRPGLAEVYRELREVESAEGPDLQEILSGVKARGASQTTGRPASLACELVRVLEELELLELDRGKQKITLATPRRTKLERSASFRRHSKRLDKGRTLLGSLRARAA